MTSNGPLKPELTFRVGVVGHRPNRLINADIDQLKNVIADILDKIKCAVEDVKDTNADLYANSAPVYKAISPLAEGADRYFAEQAMNLGWHLCCVMPFAQEEYEKSFTGDNALADNSLGQFREILNKARANRQLTVLQLDGTRKAQNDAYKVGGDVVLGLSDILLAIWDGNEERDKRGGTGKTIKEAINAGIPVILIDAKAPHSWHIYNNKSDSDNNSDILNKIIKSLLVVPHKVNKEKGDYRVRPEAECLTEFYQEKEPQLNFAFIWSLFRDVIGNSNIFPKINWRIKPFEQDAIEHGWPEDISNPPSSMINFIRPYYSWANGLANAKADKYRSTFLLCYIFAALAVGMALIPLVIKGNGIKPVFGILELLFIIVALALFITAKCRHWHERWLDYRLIAELIRHLRIVAPVFGRPAFPGLPVHHAKYGQPQATWMNWYVQAVARSVKLSDSIINRDYLAIHLADFRSFLEQQKEFHKNNKISSELLEKRLHHGIIISLIVTIIACILHLLHLWLPGEILTLLCGFCPAVSAALAAINNHGEFRRMAKRSHAMSTAISKMIIRITELEKAMTVQESIDKSTFCEVRQFTLETAYILIREVLDWRILFEDRPPEVG